MTDQTLLILRAYTRAAASFDVQKPGVTPLGVIGSATPLVLNPTDAGGLSARADFPTLLAPLDTTMRRNDTDLLVTALTSRLTLDCPWPTSLQPGGDGTFPARLYAQAPGGYSALGAAVGLPGVPRDLDRWI
ncbi:hypothetical protein [Deinococcus sp.]|uniref:hypothetical protein n=1 Tax=Deinococcus sp. TaxID=47478 RepID=UPI002869AFA2|nr:hypothetical protein [Deinococcus sp.]